MSVKRQVVRAAGIIVVAMFISRILGFVREQVLATQFGQTSATDAYIAAFTIPDFLYNLLVGGALSSAFIPIFSGYLAKGQKEDAWIVASTFINVIIIVMSAGIALGMIFTPYLIPLVAHNFDGETLELTVFLTRLMFPAVLFTGLNGLLMGILNSYQHFTAPSIGSIVYNLGIIAMGIILAPKIGIAGFAVGVIVGVLGNFAVQFPALLKKGLLYKPVIDLKHPGVKRIWTLMIPAVIGLSVTQINLIVNQNFASALVPGSITALRMANRLMYLPLGIFAVAIGIAVFPTMTSQVATDKIREFKNTLSFGLRAVLFISIPAAAGLIALRVPVVRLLFEQGQFDRAATYATAYALFYYSIGLFAQAAIQVVVRAFYALQDTKTPVKIGIITIFLNYLFSIFLIGPLSHGGLALSYSLTSIFNIAALLVILRKKIGPIDGRRLLLTGGKILLASVIMGLVSFETAQLFEQDHITKLGQLIQVGAAITAGLLSYGLLAYLLKIEEVSVITSAFKKKFKPG